LLYFVITLFSY